MNRIDPSLANASGEDAVAFPPEWRPHTLDWRGRGTPRDVMFDVDAPQRLKALAAEHAPTLDGLIRGLRDRAHEAPIRNGLAGAADPFGAAMAVAILARIDPGQRRLIEDTGRDAWVTAHGVAFAAQAAVELIGHAVRCGGVRNRATLRTDIDEPAVPRLALVSEYLRFLSPLRSLIAALPEREHAEVRAAVEASRTTGAKTFAAALLMPDQEHWALEACALHEGDYYFSETASDLIWAIASTPERLERTGVKRLNPRGLDEGRLARLVDALGAHALPILVNTLESAEKPDNDMRRLLYEAIGCLPSEAGLARLIGDLTDPLSVPAARDAARRFPVRALRAIAASAPNATAAARARFNGFARANGLLDAVAALGDRDREHIESMAASLRRHPVAEAPQAFTTPPWAPFTKPASKPLVLTPPAIDELRWAPGEREEWRTSSQFHDHWSVSYQWGRYFPDALDPGHFLFLEFLAFAGDDRTRPVLDLWDGITGPWEPSTVPVLLARYGEEIAPRVQTLVAKRSSLRKALLPFVNLDAARLAARWISRSRNDRDLAKQWLDRHAADAAAFLVPDAVGKDAKLRKAAIDALRYLDRSIVDRQSAAYGEAASVAVAAILDADPLDPQLGRLPKPGAWADPAMLPQLLSAGREAALPDAAVRTFLTALAIDDPEHPYAGVDVLAAECDPISLAVFSWSLFELWLSAGSPPKDSWAMDQLRRFADDGAVRRLTALIREWPGQSQSRKAVRGVEILGGVGSEAALRAVHDLSRKAKFKALKQMATEQIEVIAERLGLDLDQLGDRLVPDFGLAEASARVLDYGPRSFTVRFDEGLKPFLVDDKGKRRASAPKPAAKDDPELAQAAYERFAALRRDLKATAAEQVKRLEGAMAAGRTWTRAEFQEFLVDHPLMWQLSSRLVWQAGDVSFRLAEDRTLADAEDEPFELPEDAVVRLAHPLTLGDEVEAWASVFADYEILQPFDQLARTAFELSEEDRKTGRLARFEGARAGGGPLIGLLNRGWKFGGPKARGGYGLYREFPEGGYVFLGSTPGVHPGYGYDNSVEQTLTNVELVLPEGEAIDPVTISEVMLVIARSSRSA
ncbi:MAG TPA: DUF4132 domain-containing protein [Glycomyces sp.]|nr:DUF4132 domain-containing protein [Glycomyces sp.]